MKSYNDHKDLTIKPFEKAAKTDDSDLLQEISSYYEIDVRSKYSSGEAFFANTWKKAFAFSK